MWLTMFWLYSSGLNDVAAAKIENILVTSLCDLAISPISERLYPNIIEDKRYVTFSDTKQTKRFAQKIAWRGSVQKVIIANWLAS